MLLIVSNLLLLLVIFYLADHGRCSGVMNNKAILSATVVTLLLLPSIIEVLTALLVLVIPEQVASIISGIIGLPILFILVKVILNKIAGLPKHQFDKTDKFVGAFFGVLKGFFLFAFIVLIYGSLFLDRMFPLKVTESVKVNVVNMLFEHQTDYYRHKVYKAYKLISGSKLSDISNDKPDSEGKTNTLLGSISADSTNVIKPVSDNYAKFSWLGKKYLLENPPTAVIMPDSVGSTPDSTNQIFLNKPTKK